MGLSTSMDPLVGGCADASGKPLIVMGVMGRLMPAFEVIGNCCERNGSSSIVVGVLSAVRIC